MIQLIAPTPAPGTGVATRASSFHNCRPSTCRDANAVSSCASLYGTMSGPTRPKPLPLAAATGWARKV